ncbi:cytochrome d ubiquinol oxidase subunit II [Aquimarina agarilytica]|uniref:cytochrome d ubiquinol oxidase subunit II n=1 Tax=Aquimarina agarilytica TaxID=1087449 RepID=UPI0002897D66|nr:cytochrome d ubiquinol oxidase subunit II [Aquimarina agarilytica]
MIYVVLFFLAFSLLLYVLLAGADFGAGIVELFSSKENQAITKKTVYRVMGPVWEANHIWIIIMIVILWVGFPSFYNILMISLHIPITLMLLGITLRGVAFVFRHYDAFKDNSQIIYDWMFKISSLVTPIFLGITFGALLSGKIIIADSIIPYSFKALYIDSWLNGFSIFTGLFFASLCAFLSSVLLIGEAENETRKIYVRKAIIATVIVVIVGFITICYGFYMDIPFINIFLHNYITISAISISAVLLYPLWMSIKNERRIYSRFFAGIQVLLILIAALAPIFPNMLFTTSGSINILNEIAPNSVIKVLGISLIIGGSVILPGLFHLLKSFKMIKILER